jgi:hypothetical protein
MKPLIASALLLLLTALDFVLIGLAIPGMLTCLPFLLLAAKCGELTSDQMDRVNTLEIQRLIQIAKRRQNP